jgi:CBS domain-containing protein
MAILIEEIMSREVFSLLPSEDVESARAYILALGITGAPVINDSGELVGMISLRDLLHDRHGDTVGERMNTPALSVTAKAPISEAGKLIGETGYHRLVVTDEAARPVGIVSAIDVVRGLVGLPAAHPATSPHYDPSTGVSWTDDRVLELDRAEAAPDGPGLLVLVRGGAGVEESVVWAESAGNVRRRLIDILSLPSHQSVQLQRVLAFRELRFRAARVDDPSQRERLVSSMIGKARANIN